MKKQIIVFLFLLFAALFLPLSQVLAMPVGTLLYRTSGDNKMYGYNASDLIVAEKGKLAHIYSGHAAIYVGKEKGIDYIVEMQPKGAIKVPAKYFVNEALGEKLIGAKLPVAASPLQIAKAVAIAKNLADNNSAYDFDFKYQKGPSSGQWTCTGLTEKVYESADISNPTNLNSLEYNPAYYAVDITADGYDNQNIYNSSGDCLADTVEYSKIERKKNMLIPAPELLGFDVGLEYEGERYIFLPYTQYLQNSLKDVEVDIEVSSSFSEPEVRGDSPILGLVLKWSLINNPISTIKQLATKVTSGVLAIKDKVFGGDSVALADNSGNYDFSFASSSASKSTSTKTTSKATSSKAVTPKTSVAKVVASKVTVGRASSTKSSAPKVATPSVAVKTKAPVVNNKPVAPVNNTVVRTVARPVIPVVNNPIPVSTPTTTPIVNYPTPTSTPIATTTATTTTVVESEVIPEAVEPATPIALIAKIYSNGDDDWLEIVNTGDTDFDLAAAGYRLEKAKTASDPTLIMRFGNEADGVYPGGTIISAHGTYLVARETSAPEIKARADAISTKSAFSWTEDSYTIYLGTAAISSDTDPDIVDKVGYGTATYFVGTAPATALKKGYALERKASATSTIELLAAGGLQEFWPRLFNSNDNSADFLLVPYDLAVIAAENSTADNEATSSEPINPDLFVNPAGLDSQGLTQLWHFDECYGEKAANELQESGQSPVDLTRSGNWLPGKWGCAAGFSYSDMAVTRGNFSSPLDPNQFTLNFYYRNAQPNFGFYLKFSGPPMPGQMASITFSPYFTEIFGFPGVDGRLNNLIWPVDYNWHQVTLIINRSDGYWSLYLDGQEVYSYKYNGVMPTFTSFEMSNNQNEPIAIDELSIWNRSLPSSEIKTINVLNQPFNPYTWPVPQKVAQLEYYWNFNENAGPLAKDLIATNDMMVKLDQWNMEGKINSGLTIGSGISIPLSGPQVSDISLSFWWRNFNYPNEGRLHLALSGNNGTIMSLIPSIFSPAFIFNNIRWPLSSSGGNDNAWHHLALTYDSYRSLLRFYVDGEKIMEKEFVKLRAGEEIKRLDIGQENWPSAIDELKIWSGTLTPAQVLAEYNSLN